METWAFLLDPPPPPPHLLPPRSHAIAISDRTTGSSGGGGTQLAVHSGGGGTQQVDSRAGSRGGAEGSTAERPGSTAVSEPTGWPHSGTWIREDRDVPQGAGPSSVGVARWESEEGASCPHGGAPDPGTGGAAGDSVSANETLVLVGTEVLHQPEEGEGVARGRVSVLRVVRTQRSDHAVGDGASPEEGGLSLQLMARVALPSPVSALAGLRSRTLLVAAGRRLMVFRLLRCRPARLPPTVPSPFNPDPSTWARPSRWDIAAAGPSRPAPSPSHLGTASAGGRGGEGMAAGGRGGGWGLQRLAWVWLSRPATLLATHSGSSHVAVTHVGGQVTLYEYIGRLRGGPMLKVGPHYMYTWLFHNNGTGNGDARVRIYQHHGGRVGFELGGPERSV